jgi:ATP-dependent protease ClpP protease subunit
MKLIVILALLTTVSTVGYKAVPHINRYIEETRLTEFIEVSSEKFDIKFDQEGVKLKSEEVKLNPKKIRTIVLNSSNTYTFRTPVTDDSVGKAQKVLFRMDRRLPKGKPIYLVLDTPGGSVFAGANFIDSINSLKRPVHTITLFAASMGFQIAQNLDRRYITRFGTLMSHRARLAGLGGQMDGELESRYNMLKKVVHYLDLVASKRLKMPLKDYKEKINPELWIHGFESVGKNAADEMVGLKCGSSMSGVIEEKMNTMFGQISVVFSECPLIKAPLSVKMGNLKLNLQQKINLMKAINAYFKNKSKFMKDYKLNFDGTLVL